MTSDGTVSEGIPAEVQAFFDNGGDPTVDALKIYQEFKPMKDVYEYTVYFRLKNKDGSLLWNMRGDFEVVREDMPTMTKNKFMFLVSGAIGECILFNIENGRMKLVKI